PGEIETVVSQHPAVTATVVVARGAPGEERGLVAYVVPQPGQQVWALELRRFVQAQVPAYMVPGAFVLVEALPLTPNGKVDRQALPAPEPWQREGGGVAPRTPTEELLATLWAGSLGVEQLSREDNFFALGGHSLLATQLVSRIRAAFAVEVPVRWVFDAP